MTEHLEHNLHPKLHAAPVKAEDTPRQRKTLLVAAVNEQHRMLAELLAERGHDLRFARSVDEALRCLHGHQIDGVVCSLQFDSWRALQFLRRVKSDEQLGDIPFVVARVQRGTMSEGMHDNIGVVARVFGADAYVDLVKAQTLDDGGANLAERLDSLMSSSTAASYEEKRRFAQRERESLDKLRRNIQRRRAELLEKRCQLAALALDPAVVAELHEINHEVNELRQFAAHLQAEVADKQEEVQRLRTENDGDVDEIQTAAEESLRQHEDYQTFEESVQTLKENLQGQEETQRSKKFSRHRKDDSSSGSTRSS
jgi:CheY-like chemotaxis protein